jgi:hypothetical protein
MIVQTRLNPREILFNLLKVYQNEKEQGILMKNSRNNNSKNNKLIFR